MDFTGMSAVAAVVSALVACATIVFVSLQTSAQRKQVMKLEDQIKESRSAIWAASFLEAVKWLQDEKIREARRKVFELGDFDKGLSDWSAEDRKQAEIVCHSYDVVGMMVRWNMVPMEIIVDSWADSIRRLWPICEPLVLERRRKQKAPEFWDDFQWLAVQAEDFDRNRSVYAEKRS